MTGKRTRYPAEFKAMVALEALRGELTTAQLAAKHGIHHTMVGDWKRQAVEGMAGVFSGQTAAQETAKSTEAEVEKLQAEIGQLVVERDLYGEPPVKRTSDTAPPGLRGRFESGLSEVGHQRAVMRPAHQLISGSSMTACHNPACTA
jgi:transposase